jgi:hypothetical protein
VIIKILIKQFDEQSEHTTAQNQTILALKDRETHINSSYHY